MWLLALPGDAGFGVFEEDAFFEEFVADRVGAGEVATFAAVVAFCDEAVDVIVGEAESVDEFGGDACLAALGFGPVDGGAGGGGVAVGEDVEDGVEVMEERAGGGEIGFCCGVVVERDVDGADDVEDGGAGLGGVEVVGEGGVVGVVLLLEEH